VGHATDGEVPFFAGSEQPHVANWATHFTTNLQKQNVEELFVAHVCSGVLGE
jgi:predicted alpha/beta hydrolase family esterase